jgi:DNA-binding transcriptional regulator YiaG
MPASAPASLKRDQSAKQAQNDSAISGADLRADRLSVGLTQTQAAEMVSVKLRTWQEWEQGKTTMQPGLRRLFRHLAGIERIPFRKMLHSSPRRVL